MECFKNQKVIKLILMLQTMANKNAGQSDMLRLILSKLPYYIIQTICENENDRFKDLCKNVLDKKVWLFGIGNGVYGRIGDGNTDDHNVLIPYPANVNVNSIIQVSSGFNHTMFISNCGDLYAMGDGLYGMLGDKDEYDHNVSTPILVYENVKQVSSGTFHTMFITNNGDLYGMGNGQYGILGDEDESYHNISTPILVYHNVKQVSSNDFHTTFITNNGDLYGMGNGHHGKLGDGDNSVHNVLTPIFIYHNVKQVSSNDFYTMFITNDGNLYGFGSNDEGMLSDKKTNVMLLKPTRIHSFKNVKQIACQPYHAMFLTNDGFLYCIWDETEYDMGNRFLYFATTPILVCDNVKQISIGNKYMSFITNNDDLYYMKFSMLKNLENIESARITGFKNIKQVCNGHDYTMFIGSRKKQ